MIGQEITPEQLRILDEYYFRYGEQGKVEDYIRDISKITSFKSESNAIGNIKNWPLENWVLLGLGIALSIVLISVIKKGGG